MLNNNNTKKKSGCSCNFFSEGGLRKTRKVKKDSIKAIVVFGKNEHNVEGIVQFKEEKNGLRIKYKITGLADGLHGFHIHEYGDLTQGCKSACKHYNPLYKSHGSLTSKERHLGDLGNIISNNKIAKGTIYAKSISLNYTKKHCIIGRMLVVHKDPDDLGMGNNPESLKTGNAGERLTCGIIGLKK